MFNENFWGDVITTFFSILFSILFLCLAAIVVMASPGTVLFFLSVALGAFLITLWRHWGKKNV